MDCSNPFPFHALLIPCSYPFPFHSLSLRISYPFPALFMSFSSPLPTLFIPFLNPLRALFTPLSYPFHTLFMPCFIPFPHPFHLLFIRLSHLLQALCHTLLTPFHIPRPFHALFIILFSSSSFIPFSYLFHTFFMPFSYPFRALYKKVRPPWFGTQSRPFTDHLQKLSRAWILRTTVKQNQFTAARCLTSSAVPHQPRCECERSHRPPPRKKEKERI